VSYQKYGVSQELVKRVKLKLKNPTIKDQVRMMVDGITKYDLQDRLKIRRLVRQAAKAMNEKLTDQQTDNIVSFVIAQKIDPSNTFHLIKLWGMFR
jgi:uncharacterized protein YpuA (DUF1002 family)